MGAALYWILCLALAANIHSSICEEATQQSHEEKHSGTLKEFYKCTVKDGATGLLNCATLRALRLLENADNQKVLEIAPGVALVKETVGSGQRKIRSMELPQDSKGKAEKLMGVLVENAADFVSSRSLKIKIPTGATQSLARSLDEARAKLKKGTSPILLWIGAKLLTTIPLFLLGLGFVSAKALIIAKIAFVFAVILFLQYYGAGRGIIGSPYGFGYGYTGTNYGTATNTIGGTQYPYARSIDIDHGDGGKSAQDLAYSGQKMQ